MYIKNHTLLGMLNASESYGIRPAELLQYLEIDEAEFYASDGVTHWNTSAKFWEYIASKNNDPHIGLKMGHEITPGIIGMLGQLSGSCGTVLEAYRTIAEFHKVFTHMLEYRCIETEQTVTIEFEPMAEWKKKYPATWRHAIEMSMTGLMRLTTLLSGRKHYPTAVRLAYQPASDNMQVYMTHLRCIPVFNQRTSAYVFNKVDLHTPVLGSNREIYFLLRKIAAEKSIRVKEERSLVSDIEYEIYHLLPNRFPSLREIALRLNISERTLQRHLKKNDLSFKELVMRAQKEMAIRLVKDNSKNIREIALLLGYNDAAAFNKSFKRWTGTTPGRFSVTHDVVLV